MIKHNQNGALNVLLPFIISLIALVAVTSFGVWAYGGRQDYKNNVNQKVTAAVAIAVQKESTTKDNQFAQTEKYPLATYHGPEAYGSVVIQYPKTWSSYVDATGTGQTAVDGYFDPGTVPAIGDASNNFALRFQVLPQSYSDVLQAIQNQQQQGSSLTFSPYAAPKVPSVVGVRVEGQIQANKSGSMIILPLRDKTIELWTEAQAFESDFDNNVLPNFSFSP